MTITIHIDGTDNDPAELGRLIHRTLAAYAREQDRTTPDTGTEITVDGTRITYNGSLNRATAERVRKLVGYAHRGSHPIAGPGEIPGYDRVAVNGMLLLSDDLPGTTADAMVRGALGESAAQLRLESLARRINRVLKAGDLEAGVHHRFAIALDGFGDLLEE